MSEMDGGGNAAMGRLASRAALPATGTVAVDGPTDEHVCLNCDTPLAGDYCHACGQRRHVHRTFGAFWHELIHGALHFEGKIWNTLPLLVWRPGLLTRRYVEGQRARFVSPIALFLFSVFLMFAVVSAFGGPIVVDAGDGREGGVYLGPGVEDKGFKAIGFETGVPRIDAAIRRANANPSLTIYKIQNSAYKFSWALIPISVPFVALLFLHRRRYRQYGAYDHLVLVTYSIAFMSLGFVVLALLRPIGLGATLTGIAMFAVPPLHMYRQLREAYRLSRWSAVWRAIALLLFAMVAATIFLVLLLGIGVLG